MRNDRHKQGVSLIEILIAVFVIAVLGMSLMSLLSGGMRVGARASDMQMASMIGARLMDRFMAIGYEELDYARRDLGPEGDIDLALLDDLLLASEGEKGKVSAESGGPKPEEGTGKSGDRSLTIDGRIYRGQYKISAMGEDLLRVDIHLSWDHYELKSKGSSGSAKLTRLIANPLAGVASSNI